MAKRDRRASRGQAAPEYIGVLTLVALAIAGGMAVALTPTGQTLARQIAAVLCRAVGGRCDADRFADTLGPCLVSRSSEHAGASVNVLAVEAKTGTALLEERFADGTVRFVVVDDAALAGTLKAGVKLDVGRAGIGGLAQVAAGGALANARIFEFGPSEKDAADAFRERTKAYGTLDAVARRVGGNPLLKALPQTAAGGFLAGSLMDLVGIEKPKDLGDAEARLLSAETLVEARAKVHVGAALDGEGAIRAARGAKLYVAGPDKGDAELYFSLNESVSGALSGQLFGPGITQRGRAVAAVRLDADRGGAPAWIDVRLDGNVTDRFAASRTRSATGPGAVLRKVSGSLEAGAGAGVSLRSRLELDAADAPRVLGAFGLPSTLVEPIALADLVRRVADEGTASLDVLSTATSQGELGVRGGLGVNLGAGGSRSSERAGVVGSYARDPGGSFEARAC